MERMWSCLILWVFCVFVFQEIFWVYRFVGDWVGYCLYGSVYLGFGFLDLFFVFLDLMEIGFSC